MQSCKKCVNVRERVEVVEGNKRWYRPVPRCPVNHHLFINKENPDRKMNE